MFSCGVLKYALSEFSVVIQFCFVFLGFLSNWQDKNTTTYRTAVHMNISDDFIFKSHSFIKVTKQLYMCVHPLLELNFVYRLNHIHFIPHKSKTILLIFVYMYRGNWNVSDPCVKETIIGSIKEVRDSLSPNGASCIRFMKTQGRYLPGMLAYVYFRYSPTR